MVGTESEEWQGIDLGLDGISAIGWGSQQLNNQSVYGSQPMQIFKYQDVGKNTVSIICMTDLKIMYPLEIVKG